MSLDKIFLLSVYKSDKKRVNISRLILFLKPKHLLFRLNVKIKLLYVFYAFPNKHVNTCCSFTICVTLFIIVRRPRPFYAIKLCTRSLLISSSVLWQLKGFSFANSLWTLSLVTLNTANYTLFQFVFNITVDFKIMCFIKLF